MKPILYGLFVYLQKQIAMSQKVTRTYEDLLILIRGLNILMSDKEILSSKAGKKLEKMAKKVQSHLDEYNEKLEDIRLDNANVDANGSLLTDEKGGYKYSKEGIKKMNADIKELLKKEFEFYQFSFSPEGLEKYSFLSKWVEGIEESVNADEDEIEQAQVVEMV